MNREGAPCKRRVEYPFQTEGAGRSASGSTILPDGESLMGQEHDGEAGVWANMPDPTPCKARAIWSRLNCLNPSHQRWKRTSRATACQGADGRIGRFRFRRPKLPLPSDGQRGRSRGRTGDLSRASPHYSREMRDQSQAVDIVHNYANGLFDEVFCNEISGPGVWWPGPISGGPMNYSG